MEGEKRGRTYLHDDPPPYPVIIARPSFGDACRNLTEGDAGIVAACTLLSLPFVAFAKPLQGPALIVAGFLGFSGGCLWAIQNSAGRLMGFRENREDLIRHSKA